MEYFYIILGYRVGFLCQISRQSNQGRWQSVQSYELGWIASREGPLERCCEESYKSTYIVWMAEIFFFAGYATV
jgi:hypothetical protein